MVYRRLSAKPSENIVAKTQVTSENIAPSAVQRSDLNTNGIAGTNVIAKAVQGTNIVLTSTGGDAGTGDVTIGVSTTPAFKDGTGFTLQNATTTTKQVQFDLSSIAAANTRTIKVPDANCSPVVDKAAVANSWINSIVGGVATVAQPQFANIAGAASTQQNGILSNFSTAAQTGFATDQYLTGSSISNIAGAWAVGGQYYCVFDMTKTAAGTAAVVVTIRAGTTGSTSDAVVMTLTLPAPATANAGAAYVEVWLNIRTTGTSGTVAAMLRTGANPPTILQSNYIGFVVGTGTMNTSTATELGISFNGGTSFSGTCQLVQTHYVE